MSRTSSTFMQQEASSVENPTLIPRPVAVTSTRTKSFTHKHLFYKLHAHIFIIYMAFFHLRTLSDALGERLQGNFLNSASSIHPYRFSGDKPVPPVSAAFTIFSSDKEISSRTRCPLLFQMLPFYRAGSSVLTSVYSTFSFSDFVYRVLHIMHSLLHSRRKASRHHFIWLCN